MAEVQVEWSPWSSTLGNVADDFAARALAHEVCRDRARPGTAVHHHHAHSATLWRQAESSLRAKMAELDATA